jgi:hypothetical protein
VVERTETSSRSAARLAAILQRFVVPSLGGDLTGRLEDAGASFLDVGVGVPRAGFSDADVHFDARWELPVAYVAGRRRDARLRSRPPECGGKLFS